MDVNIHVYGCNHVRNWNGCKHVCNMNVCHAVLHRQRDTEYINGVWNIDYWTRDYIGNVGNIGEKMNIGSVGDIGLAQRLGPVWNSLGPA